MSDEAQLPNWSRPSELILKLVRTTVIQLGFVPTPTPFKAGPPESWTDGHRLYGGCMAQAERRAGNGVTRWAPTAPGT